MYKNIFGKIWICLILSGIACFAATLLFENLLAKMLLGVAAFQIIPQQLLALFNDDPNLIGIGVRALRTISLAFIFAGFCIVSGSVFQALGKGKYSLIMSATRQLVFLLPIAYLFSLTGNVDLVWLGFPLAEIASVTLCIIYIKRIFKKIQNYCIN